MLLSGGWDWWPGQLAPAPSGRETSTLDTWHGTRDQKEDDQELSNPSYLFKLFSTFIAQTIINF